MNLHDLIDHLSSGLGSMSDPSYDPSLLVISLSWNHDMPQRNGLSISILIFQIQCVTDLPVARKCF